jgi:hypothetical protein
MANTIRIPRAHLILLLCLPLAVLVGYFLGEPTDPLGMATVTLLLAVLSAPLTLKYHHPLLLVAWNAAIGFLFLPGQPGLWMVLAFVSLMLSVFHRATDPDKRFLECPSLTKPLLLFAAVVGVTALLTGGVGFRIFGSSHYGGRYYLEIAAAIAGYFALTSQRISSERAGLYVSLFFLSALTGIISNLIYLAGPQFYFLYMIFPSGAAASQAAAEASLWRALPRFESFAPASLGLLCFLLARYGLRGTFDYAKPWRWVAFLLAFLCCLLSGFRSSFFLFLGICFCVFLLEGLWRSRAMPILLLAALGILAVVLPQSDRLPSPIQRCLSFLPIKVDPAVAEEARYSTEWRLDMWRQLEPQIPQYLIKGKGYNFDANDLARAQTASTSRFGWVQEVSEISMEYHSGPLSVLIPFGIAGMLGFLWLLLAGVRLLYCNYRYGDPALLRTNALLLAAFVCKAILFFVVFGALHAELFWYTGLLGLSVSLNGGMCQPMAEPELLEEEPGVEVA